MFKRTCFVGIGPAFRPSGKMAGWIRDEAGMMPISLEYHSDSHSLGMWTLEYPGYEKRDIPRHRAVEIAARSMGAYGANALGIKAEYGRYLSEQDLVCELSRVLGCGGTPEDLRNRIEEWHNAGLDDPGSKDRLATELKSLGYSIHIRTTFPDRKTHFCARPKPGRPMLFLSLGSIDQATGHRRIEVSVKLPPYDPD